MVMVIAPETTKELGEVIAAAVAGQRPMQIEGHASKAGFGRPPAATDDRLRLDAISGILSYEPEELVLSARAGTPLAEIEAALAERDQQLAFEPANLGAFFAGLERPDAAGTLGGVVSCNLSGPRRLTAGAARDHLLGFCAISGRAEPFKAGGRVVKNVTGFDLSKLIAGSFGTLAVITEMTVRALPRPEDVRTVVVSGCSPEDAVKAMTAALQSTCDVSGAAHLTADIVAASAAASLAESGSAATVLRLEGPSPSVTGRARHLRRSLASFGPCTDLDRETSCVLWREIRDVSFFAGDETQVWRLSVPPSDGAAVAAEVLRGIACRLFFDWAGGLIWLSLNATAVAGEAVVRSAVSRTGGHATLVRADDAVRTRVSVFQPQPPPLAAITRRVKDAFDPLKILNPGRMYEGI
jgi:glycolate oxidase FAD binding subunit